MKIIKGCYNFSDTLHGVLQQFTQNDKAMVIQMLDHYIEEYKRIKATVDAASTAYNFYLCIDKLIKKHGKCSDGMKIQCSKGCSSCCKTNVDITRDEAILIHEYCLYEEIIYDRDKLKRQSKFDSSNWFEQPKEDQSCVFLNEYTQCCMIYEYRPVNCRKLFSLSAPQHCNTENEAEQVCRFVNTEVEIISSALMTAAPSGSMSKLLYDILLLNKEHETKREIAV